MAGLSNGVKNDFEWFVDSLFQEVLDKEYTYKERGAKRQKFFDFWLKERTLSVGGCRPKGGRSC